VPRVLLLSPYFPPHVGGLENHVRLLAAELAGRGVDVQVLTSSIGNGPQVLQADLPPGVRVCRVASFELGNDAIFLSLLRRCLRALGTTDILHMHGHLFYSTTVGALVGDIGRVPTVLTFHGDFDKPTAAGRLIKRVRAATQGAFILRALDHAIALTPDDRDLLVRWGVEPERITIIPNGIPLGTYRPAGEDARRDLLGRLDLGPDERPFLFVGRLVDQKGVPYLLEAIGLVVREHPSAHFVIVGDGPLMAPSMRRCAGLGLEESVTFAGRLPLEDLVAAYSCASAVVAPSLWEGMPLVVLEANACGAPVVGSDIPGIRGLVEPGGTGLLVPPRRPDELARAVGSLIESPGDARRMSAAALAKARREFDLSKQVEATIGVYERLAGTMR
jgi:glycosyltransferase involved in cell wall biosynthesis